MKIKRTLCVAVAFIMVMSLFTACGNSKSDSSKNSTKDTTNDTVKSSEATDNDNTEDKNASSDNEEQTTPAESGKTLVVYYSATGSTESVAKEIAKELGADIFEITPKQPYTSDDLNWSNDNSRVSKEHNDESLRDVELATITPDKWEEYNTVIIGYPIWWGIAAWPVDNFIKGNDFTGKTIIPFCTSASSGIGNSGSLLEEMAGTGNWQKGKRFSSGASASDIDEWVNSLNISE